MVGLYRPPCRRKVGISGCDSNFLDFFHEVSIDDHSVCGRTLRLRERVVIEDVEKDTAFEPFLPIARASGFRAVQSTPLLDHNGKVMGVISTHFSSPHRLSRSDLRRLDLCARQAADFIQRIKLEHTILESEGRFRRIADAAPVMIWMSGAHKVRTWFNQPWLDFAGRLMEQELGNGWTANVHPDDHNLYIKEFISAFDARESFSTKYRLKRNDGEYRWMLDRGIPMYNAAGKFNGYMGSCIDITEHNRPEA